MRELGCDLVQGFLISPPMEASSLQGWRQRFRKAWPRMLEEEKLALWGNVETDTLSEGQI